MSKDKKKLSYQAHWPPVAIPRLKLIAYHKVLPSQVAQTMMGSQSYAINKINIITESYRHSQVELADLFLSTLRKRRQIITKLLMAKTQQDKEGV